MNSYHEPVSFTLNPSLADAKCEVIVDTRGTDLSSGEKLVDSKKPLSAGKQGYSSKKVVPATEYIFTQERAALKPPKISPVPPRLL
jgi:hypothetical protein